METGMTNHPGCFLVVDDNRMNRLKLARGLEEQGHTVTMAEDGRQALALLRAQAFDVVLLDILMPEVDGYQVLAEMKGDEALRDIPVIVISAVDEMDSVVRCIEMGATDYLPKPFNAALLQARINASLAAKHLRDLELEYLEQVGHVINAAAAVEAGSFEMKSLDGVAARVDALGNLARVFQRMAREVYAREQRLKQQIQELRIEIDEARQARKVAEITETDYFQKLRQQAQGLRQIIAGDDQRPE
jgi:CheY-like chemotaxis protein